MEAAAVLLYLRAWIWGTCTVPPVSLRRCFPAPVPRHLQAHTHLCFPFSRAHSQRNTIPPKSPMTIKPSNSNATRLRCLEFRRRPRSASYWSSSCKARNFSIRGYIVRSRIGNSPIGLVYDFGMRQKQGETTFISTGCYRGSGVSS